MGGVQSREGRSATGRSEDDEKSQEAHWEHWYCYGGGQGWEAGDDLADILVLQLRGVMYPNRPNRQANVGFLAGNVGSMSGFSEEPDISFTNRINRLGEQCRECQVFLG
jgi:hypothetical protein